MAMEPWQTIHSLVSGGSFNASDTQKVILFSVSTLVILQHNARVSRKGDHHHRVGILS